MGSIRAHRYSYERYKGPIPDGSLVCHSCDNPGCVNPEHLWLGSQSDNVKDKIEKNRLGRTGWNLSLHAPKGEQHHEARLTEEDVRTIRRKAGEGRTGYQLAKDYRYDPSSIYRILRRETWKNIN